MFHIGNMSKFRKAILKPGRYHSPDGVVDVTPARLRHWEKQFRQMSKARQVVPIDWDHAESQSDLQPLTMDAYERRRSAQNTIGHLADFRVNADGTAAEITLDLRTDKAVEAASKNTVYVSPVLFPEWKDGAGNTYQDCITHVDMVNHPVDHSQTPFVPVEPQTIACALRMSLSPRPYRFSGDPKMADEKDDEKKPFPPKDDADDAPADDAPPIDAPPDDSAIEEAAAAEKANNGRLVDVLSALAKMSIILPQDTDASNLLDRLYTGLLTAAAKDGQNSDAGLDTGMAGDSKIIDPDISTMSLEGRKAYEYAEKQHRKSLGQRLDALLAAGQCTPHEAKQRKLKLPSVRLSLDASTGEARPTKLEEWLESREAVPKGTFWDDQQRLSLARETILEPPSHMRGEPTKEEVNETAAWALGKKK